MLPVAPPLALVALFGSIITIVDIPGRLRAPPQGAAADESGHGINWQPQALHFNYLQFCVPVRHAVRRPA